MAEQEIVESPQKTNKDAGKSISFDLTPSELTSSDGDESLGKKQLNVTSRLSRSFSKKDRHTNKLGLVSTLCKKNNHVSIFNLMAIIMPTLATCWFSVAIFFSSETREKYPFFLWDDGHFQWDNESTTSQPMVCPRASICSQGWLEIALLALARISAFASYVVMGVTFLTKMHSLNHFLSSTYLRAFIPFETFHDIHSHLGIWFAVLTFSHAISHYIRYIIREDGAQLRVQVHYSGLIALTSMGIVVLSMMPFVKKRIIHAGFETRLTAHWFFLLLVIALSFHTPRTRLITLTFL